MNISGIFLTTKPEYVENIKTELSRFDWAEVHQTDEKGRMVITIEGVDTNEEVKRLKEIKSIPNVLSAEMVYHYFEDEAKTLSDTVGKDDSGIFDKVHF